MQPIAFSGNIRNFEGDDTIMLNMARNVGNCFIFYFVLSRLVVGSRIKWIIILETDFVIHRVCYI